MLRMAILSLLADREYSGYELSKLFDASVTYIWAAGQSQIYPELHRLDEKGLVESAHVPQEDKPDKRMYRITDRGRESLIDWVTSSPGPLTLRDPFQLRTVNFGRVPRDRAIELLTVQRDLLVRRVDSLRSVKELLAEVEGEPAGPGAPGIGWSLSVEAGLRIYGAYIEWCDWAAEQLRRSEPSARATRRGWTS